MTVETFGCPSCNARLRRSEALSTGTRVRCPRCSTEFTVPPPDEPAAPPPPAPRRDDPDDAPRRRPALRDREDEDEPRRRPMRRDDDDEDDGRDDRRRGRYRDDLPERDPRGRSRRDEYDEDDDVRDRPSRRGRSRYDDDDDRGRERLRVADLDPKGYSVSLGDWMNVAGKHWGDYLGPYIGAVFLMGFIYLVAMLPVIFLSAAMGRNEDGRFVLQGVQTVINLMLNPLFAGVFVVPLKMLRDRTWSFGDFFGGFARFGSLLLFGFLQTLIVVFLIVPFVLLAFALGPRTDPLVVAALFAVGAAVTLVVSLKMSFFGTLLILDQKFSAVDAISGSMKLTRGHLLGLFAMSLFFGLLATAGVLACIIGVLFTMPLVILAWTAGYLRAVSATIYDPQGRVIRDPNSRYRDEEEDDEDDDVRGGRRR